MGWFGKKKRRPDDGAGASEPQPGIPSGQPPAPMGIPSGQPPPPAGIPMGQPPSPVGHRGSGIEDWRQLCQQQKAQLQDKVRAVVDDCQADVASTQMDTSWVDRRFLALDRDTEAAKTLVRSTWNRGSGFEGEDAERELDRIELDLFLIREEGYRWVRAQAARSMMNFALFQDSRTRMCPYCGQPMVGLMVSQSQHLPCASCGQTQLAEPGQAFRTFASSAARWVGEWDGFPQFAEMKRAEAVLQSYRDKSSVPLADLEAYHRCAEQYWSTVLVMEAQLVPEKQQHMTSLLETYMTGANRLLSSFWQWRSR
jgi:hypothetical protein